MSCRSKYSLQHFFIEYPQFTTSFNKMPLLQRKRQVPHLFISLLWERVEMHTRFGWREFRENPPLGIHKRRWENNMKMDLQQVGYGVGGMDCIDLAQDKDKWRAFVIWVVNLQFLLNVGIFLTS